MSGTNSISNSMLITLASFTRAISVKGSTANDLAAKFLKNNSQAEGLVERSMSQTSSTSSSLKDKMVSFASGIKASISALCARLFGWETKSTGPTASASEPTSVNVSHEGKMRLLNALSDKLIADAQTATNVDPGKAKGMFRESNTALILQQMTDQVNAGQTPDFNRFELSNVAGFFKKQFNELAQDLNENTFNEAVEKANPLYGSINAQEVYKTYISGFSSDNQEEMKSMLDTIAQCRFYAEDGTSTAFNKRQIETAFKMSITPNSITGTIKTLDAAAADMKRVNLMVIALLDGAFAANKASSAN